MLLPELSRSEYEDYCKRVKDQLRTCGYCGRPINTEKLYVMDKGKPYHLYCVDEMERYGGTDD